MFFLLIVLLIVAAVWSPLPRLSCLSRPLPALEVEKRTSSQAVGDTQIVKRDIIELSKCIVNCFFPLFPIYCRGITRRRVTKQPPECSAMALTFQGSKAVGRLPSPVQSASTAVNNRSLFSHIGKQCCFLDGKSVFSHYNCNSRHQNKHPPEWDRIIIVYSLCLKTLKAWIDIHDF